MLQYEVYSKLINEVFLWDYCVFIRCRMRQGIKWFILSKNHEGKGEVAYSRPSFKQSQKEKASVAERAGAHLVRDEK